MKLLSGFLRVAMIALGLATGVGGWERPKEKAHPMFRGGPDQKGKLAAPSGPGHP